MSSARGESQNPRELQLYSRKQPKSSSRLFVASLVLLFLAVLLFLYSFTYKPRQQHLNFEGRIDNPSASAVASSPREKPTAREITSRPERTSPPSKIHSHHSSRTTLGDFQHHASNEQQSTQQQRQGTTQQPSASPTTDQSPCVVGFKKASPSKKPGFFKRIWNGIKWFFGVRRKEPPRTNSAPIVCSVESLPSVLTLPCPPGTPSDSCPVSADQSIRLNAKVIDADKDTLLYTWSVTGGRVTGEGRDVTWDLSAVSPGTYTASVEVNDGNQHTASGTATVTVSSCSDCTLLCPTVSVSCPSDVSTGDQITFTAMVSPETSVTYNWSVSAGDIISGQGTSSVTVDTSRSAGQTLTATVELGELDPSCSRQASCSTAIQGTTAARLVKFDEFGNIRFNEEKARLDQLALAMRNDPGTRVFIITYGVSEGESLARGSEAANYLIRTRGIGANRISVIDGGCRPEPGTQIWLAPPGASPPTPNIEGSVPCDELVVLGMVPPGEGPPLSHFTLSGTVRGKDGEILAGATVTVLGPKGFRKQTITNPNGHFRFQGLGSGTYTLEITAPGYDINTIEGVEIDDDNLTLDGIEIHPEKRTIKLRERDRVRVSYPDHLLVDPPGEITFALDRILSEHEVGSSETNTNGRIEIVDKPPPAPSATPETTYTQAYGEQYTAFAKVTLIADGLTILSSPETPELSLKESPAVWNWKVNPKNPEGKLAGFKFHVDIVWRGEGLPDKHLSYDWDKAFFMKIGPPASVKAATYGAPVVAACSFLAFVGGFSKRKKLLEGADVAPTPAVEVTPEDEVATSVYAPSQVLPGNSFLVQVFAHVSNQSPAEFADEARLPDKDAELKISETLDKTIKRETPLTFTLSIDGLTIDEPQQTRVWRGKNFRVLFSVTVPKDFEPKEIIARLMVCEYTVPVGRLLWKFEVVKAVDQHADDAVNVGMATRFKQAFISYSSKDRSEVMKRVQAFDLAGLPYFVDFLTLRPGDQWSAQIYDYIDKSDVFFLFWSSAASASKEVEKEFNYALQKQGGNRNAAPAIVPVMLAPPAPPPPTLNYLHFNDKIVCHIKPPEAGA
jgi:hypothetical protein